MKILLEGVDGTGKSTLAKLLAKEFDIDLVKHLGKPKSIKRYSGCKVKYQKDIFRRFNKVMNSKIDIIYDRAHLGEYVYGPLYRDEACMPMGEVEKGFGNTITLVLLIATNFEILRDDGLGFDISNQEKEQDLFIEAFNNSKIKDKMIVNIHDEHGFRPIDEIKEEIMNMKSTGERVYIPRNAWWASDIDYANKLSDAEKDWLLNFNSLMYDNKVKNNPVASQCSPQQLEELKEDYNSRKKCVINRGLGNNYEERGDYENLQAPKDDEIIELAKLGAREAKAIIDQNYNDMVWSGLMNQDEADMYRRSEKQAIDADEKKMLAKRYSRLTKSEMKALKDD